MIDKALQTIATDRALAVFEDRLLADEWLRTPCASLGNVAPLNFLVDEAGLGVVLRTLAAIEYGLPP